MGLITLPVVVVSMTFIKVINLQKQWQTLQVEIVAKENYHKKIKEEISQLELQRNKASNTINDLQKTLVNKHASLRKLDAKINAVIQNAQDIESKIEPPEKPITLLEQQQPIVDGLPTAVIAEFVAQWYIYFDKNPHLDILKYIEKYGVITESEASNILGNYRNVRQFNNNLQKYSQDLPFSIKVESSASGIRYIKQLRDSLVSSQ